MDGVGVAVAEAGVVVGVLCWEQAIATKIKEQSKKLKTSMFFTSASRAFEIRPAASPNGMSSW
jgi:hypothetical protein